MLIPTAEIVVNGRRKIVNADDPRVNAHAKEKRLPEKGRQEVTRESIARMKKPDVVDLLAAHGVEGASGSLPSLRNQLTAVMFVDI